MEPESFVDRLKSRAFLVAIVGFVSFLAAGQFTEAAGVAITFIGAERFRDAFAAKAKDIGKDLQERLNVVEDALGERDV
jgi:hypothetical protein